MPLLVCATPIGNLADVTQRVLDALRDADLVLCEDTRRTRVLLDRYGIRARGLVSVHRHNEARQARELLPRLRAGETLALVSDAGLPGVNDPGGRLVEAALAADIAVTVLPGPSAVETALVASGLGTAQYRFLGYLPRRAAELGALWGESRVWPYTGGRLRVAETSRPVARGAGGRRSRSPRRSLPRADEALRGDRPRKRRRARGTLSRAGQGRGDDRHRHREPHPSSRSTRAVEAVRELVAAGAARRSRGRRRRAPRRASRATSSTAARSRSRPIDVVRRPRYASFSALPAQRMKEVPRASSSRIRGGGSRGARGERLRRRVVVAGGRRRAPAVRARRRRVRRRPAPRHRRRGGGRLAGSRAGRRHRELRRFPADVRPRRHDPHRGRLRDHAGSSRVARGRQGRHGVRGCRGRDHGLERRARARCPVGSPRRSPRGRAGGIRRSTRLAASAPGGSCADAAGSGSGSGRGTCARDCAGGRAGRVRCPSGRAGGSHADDGDGPRHAGRACDAAGCGGRPRPRRRLAGVRDGARSRACIDGSRRRRPDGRCRPVGAGRVPRRARSGSRIRAAGLSPSQGGGAPGGRDARVTRCDGAGGRSRTRRCRTAPRGGADDRNDRTAGSRRDTCPGRGRPHVRRGLAGSPEPPPGWSSSRRGRRRLPARACGHGESGDGCRSTARPRGRPARPRRPRRARPAPRARDGGHGKGRP